MSKSYTCRAGGSLTWPERADIGPLAHIKTIWITAHLRRSSMRRTGRSSTGLVRGGDPRALSSRASALVAAARRGLAGLASRVEPCSCGEDPVHVQRQEITRCNDRADRASACRGRAGDRFGPGGDDYLRFALIEDPPRIEASLPAHRSFLPRRVAEPHDRGVFGRKDRGRKSARQLSSSARSAWLGWLALTAPAAALDKQAARTVARSPRATNHVSRIHARPPVYTRPTPPSHNTGITLFRYACTPTSI